MSKNKNIDGETDLKKYRDSDGVSIEHMNFGLWLSENRRRITKIVIIALIAISAFFFIYSSYHYIVYFITGDEQELLDGGNLLMSPRNITEDLEISVPQIFSSNGGYDMAVKAKNPNIKFSAAFKYCFVQGEEQIACSNGFILPGEEKYILAMGRKLEKGPAGISFEISDFSWQRLNSRQIPDWEYFSFSRLDFSIFDIDFNPASTTSTADKVSLNYLEFFIKNQTPYSYYEAPLNILFFNGSELVGINRYLISDFLSGEERQIRLSWPGDLRRANRTEIKPDINILSDSVYLKYQGSNK